MASSSSKSTTTATTKSKTVTSKKADSTAKGKTTLATKNVAVADKNTTLSETSAAYDAARAAMNAQLANVDKRLETTLGNLSREYSAQQGQLNSQRNAASTSASLQAALTGGGFGGQSELAKRKYYSDSFVPAQTQLNTNLSNDRASARQQAEDSRLALQQQLANIETQAATYGLQRYDTNYWNGLNYNQSNAQTQASLEEAWRNRHAELATTTSTTSGTNKSTSTSSSTSSGSGSGSSSTYYPTYVSTNKNKNTGSSGSGLSYAIGKLAGGFLSSLYSNNSKK